MKHLKLFESYKNSLWQEIEPSEFNKVVFGGQDEFVTGLVELTDNYAQYIKSKWEDFTKDEVQKIMDLFPNHEYNYTQITVYHARKPNFIENKGSITISNDNEDNEDQFQIYKIKDEWFYVSDERFLNTYYKCDQFEGLIQFLKKIK